MENHREAAIAAAKEAGDYLLAHFRKDAALLTERGSSKEILTKYDEESDRIIIEGLRKRFPDHGLLTEESGAIEGASEHVWIVDSLDGSGNYASGNPFFSVSIALMAGDDLVLGVVYAPFLGELYVAEKGRGATLNGEPIRVSGVASLAKGYVVTCEGQNRTHDRIARAYGIILPRAKDMRKIGSAALESCMVACGRADAYITFEIDPWDVAAGVLICREAGGKDSDYSGEPWRCERTDLVVTNGKLHAEMLAAAASIPENR